MEITKVELTHLGFKVMEKPFFPDVETWELSGDKPLMYGNGYLFRPLPDGTALMINFKAITDISKLSSIMELLGYV